MARLIVVAAIFAFLLAGCSTSDSNAEKGQGSIVSVSINNPTSGPAGQSQICWQVEGAGNVAHVAIHWDSSSHTGQSTRTFADYNLGAAYPANTAELKPQGYDLPGDFCANVNAPATGSLYIVGHAIGSEGAPGRLSAEVRLDSTTAMTGTATSVQIVSTPTATPAGSMATVCWTVAGAGRVAHVAIHWDDVTHQADTDRTFQSYDLGASYPNNQSSASASGYLLEANGARFCTSAQMPATGSIFVVGHVIDATGSPGKLSSEREIRVGTPTILIQGFGYSPSTLTVSKGETVTVQNADATMHTVTGSGFDTADVPASQTKTFIAPMTAGSYPFTCAYHSSMQGTLVVS